MITRMRLSAIHSRYSSDNPFGKMLEHVCWNLQCQFQQHMLSILSVSNLKKAIHPSGVLDWSERRCGALLHALTTQLNYTAQTTHLYIVALSKDAIDTMCNTHSCVDSIHSCTRLSGATMSSVVRKQVDR